MKDNQVVGFEPWEEFPFNRGKLCPKGVKRYMQNEHPDRLARRSSAWRASGFAPIGWDAALDRTASRDEADPGEHGRDAFAVLTGASLTNEKAYLMGKFARVALRTANIDYNGRLCMVSRGRGLEEGVRHRSQRQPVERHPEGRGASSSPARTSPSARRSPPTTSGRRARTARKLIVLDPRLTPIARTVDLFIPVRPGGDIGVFNAMLHVMIERGWIDRDFIAAAHHRLGRGRDGRSAKYTPEYAAKHRRRAGVDDRASAAELWGPAKTSFLLHARGIEHHTKGVENCLAAINLVVATGPHRPRRAAATR